MKKGEFLLSIRKKHKASRAKFAELLEVSPSSIEKAEKELIPVTPENKYVKAVCALEGLDNEIFKYDEITNEILKEHELSRFSKAFRKFLYFYYGDFWNEEIYKTLNDELIKIIKDFTEFWNKMTLVDLIENFSISKSIITNYDKVFLKKTPYELFTEIMLIISLSKFYHFNVKPSQFEHIPNEYINFLKNEEEINYLFSDLQKEDVSFTLKRNLIIKELSELEDKGVLITIENIKKLKKQKELEKIQNEVIPAPTDPKDKQICELLQYAPPAFKDKIIEKLLGYKKDVEEF